ncbi:MAG: Fic family protein [Candidatus Gastranaerophilales bacterium]|nr:Fic family protein [Candidatus Gastranaerophilales bacterium]
MIIPNDLKLNDLKITSQMLTIIAEIDEFKGEWKALGRLSPDILNPLKKVATIESVGSSNRIEGNKLSDKQVEELLSRIDKKSFASRDEEEVAGYADLMNLIFDDYEIITLSENYIKQLHSILLKYSKKDIKHKGEYKKHENSVAAYDANGKEIGIIFETASPYDTPRKMEELIEWARKNIEDRFHHPLIVIGIFIVNFLAIHPFQDGNGRLSRALTSLLLLKTGYTYASYSSMEAIIEDNKESYYRTLRQTQITLNKDNPEYEAWLMFFLKTLQKQKIRLEHKIKNDAVSKLSLPELSVQILDLFNQKERITVSDIVGATNANINTVKKHVASLVNINYLTKHGTTRGVWYTKN